MGIFNYNPSPFNKDTQTIFTWIDSVFNSGNGLPVGLYTLNINGQSWNASISLNPQTSLQFTIDPLSYGTYTANLSNIENTYNRSQSVSINCFVKGTNILSKNNEYVKIENLKIGDEIKTFKNGYVKIKHILVREMKNENSIHQIHKLKNENLYLTGGHSLLVDDLNESEKTNTLKTWGELKKVDEKFMLLTCFATNSNVVKINDNNIYDLYHIVLESDNDNTQYGIYANEVLTETMSIKCYNESIKFKINFV